MEYIYHLIPGEHSYARTTTFSILIPDNPKFAEIGIARVDHEDNFNRKEGVRIAREAVKNRKPNRFKEFDICTLCDILNKYEYETKEYYRPTDLSLAYLFAYLFAKKDKTILANLFEKIYDIITEDRYNRKSDMSLVIRNRSTYVLCQDVRIGKLYKAGSIAVYDPDVYELNFYWLDSNNCTIIPKEFQPDQNLDLFKKIY